MKPFFTETTAAAWTLDAKPGNGGLHLYVLPPAPVLALAECYKPALKACGGLVSIQPDPVAGILTWTTRDSFALPTSGQTAELAGSANSRRPVHSWIGRRRIAGKLPVVPYVSSGKLVVDELGRPLRPQYYSDLFEQQVAAAGLPPLTLHGARHFAASLFGHLDDIVVAAAWLGQSQTSITEQYQHAFHDALREAGSKLGTALRKGL